MSIYQLYLLTIDNRTKLKLGKPLKSVKVLSYTPKVKTTHSSTHNIL